MLPSAVEQATTVSRSAAFADACCVVVVVVVGGQVAAVSTCMQHAAARGSLLSVYAANTTATASPSPSRRVGPAHQ